MKLLRIDAQQLVFELSAREKILLVNLLGRYPVVASGNHSLNRHGAGDPELQASQTLLDESLAEHRKELRQELQALLNDPARFPRVGEGFQLVLERPHIEWLLQVLNDIRIGSWIRLGSPTLKDEPRLQLTENTVADLWAMDVSALFQNVLLKSLL